MTEVAGPLHKTPVEVELNLPAGFHRILAKLCRAIVRSQPNNLFRFAARYLEVELYKRNEKLGGF
jgi:hypothetical protein